MAFTVNVTDGKVTGSKSVDNVENTNKQATSTTKNKTQETKDMFMKLLVAEMKYQNPLEPTDNTEYVKEMASFSQVEALENVSGDMEQIHGNSLVGQIATATDENGNSVTGKVEYTYQKDGETYLHIMNGDYTLSQITGSEDSEYYTAQTLVQTINEELNDLPVPSKLTRADVDRVNNLAKIYNAMTTYEQSFLPQSTVDTIKELVDAAAKLSGNGKKTTPSTDKTTDDAAAEAAQEADSQEAATQTASGDESSDSAVTETETETETAEA